MTTIVLTQTGNGSSNYMIPDYFIPFFNIGLQAIVSGTVASYSVEYTLDDTQSPSFDASTANWNPITNFSAISSSTWGVFTVPCRGIRVTITNGASGAVALTLCQAGTR
jgi:hypothetical protein